MGRFRIEIPVRVRAYDEHMQRFAPDGEIGYLRFSVRASSRAEACQLVSSYMETRLTPPLPPPPTPDEDEEGAEAGME